MPCIKLRKSHIKPLGDDQFAEIVSGNLLIEGRTRLTSVESRDNGRGRTRLVVSDLESSVPRGALTLVTNDVHGCDTMPLYCLPLAVARFVPRFSGPTLDCSALEIELALCREQKFRRIGAFDSESRSAEGHEALDRNVAEWLFSAK